MPCRGFLQRRESDGVCTQLWLQSYLLIRQHARMQAIDDLLLSITAIFGGGFA